MGLLDQLANIAERRFMGTIKEDCIEELYNLEKDPDELNNLAVDSQHHTLLKRLREKAVEEFRKKDGSFVDYLPIPKIISL